MLSGPLAATGHLRGMEEAPAVWMFLVLYMYFSFFSQNLAVNTETPNTQVCKTPLEEQEQLYANVVPRQQRSAQ